MLKDTAVEEAVARLKEISADVQVAAMGTMLRHLLSTKDFKEVQLSFYKGRDSKGYDILTVYHIAKKDFAKDGTLKKLIATSLEFQMGYPVKIEPIKL